MLPSPPDESGSVCYFAAAAEAPRNPLNGTRRAGWHWRSSGGGWDGPALNGQAEARRFAKAARTIRAKEAA